MVVVCHLTVTYFRSRNLGMGSGSRSVAVHFFTKLRIMVTAPGMKALMGTSGMSYSIAFIELSGVSLYSSFVQTQSLRDSESFPWHCYVVLVNVAIVLRARSPGSIFSRPTDFSSFI